jgi:hypothetical protein
MDYSARDLLETVRYRLAPEDDENRLVPLIASGQAPVSTIAALAAEEYHIVASDRRSFLALAARAASAEPDGAAEGVAAASFFSTLAQGESLAFATLPALAAAAGMDGAALRDYQPQAGCQAYPAYVAWLALNGEPAEVVLAMVANFAAWGGYCATLAGGLREHYGFDDEACGFFDFFATPAPELEEQALAAVHAEASLALALRYGQLLQSYELMFWNSLADLS